MRHCVVSLIIHCVFLSADDDGLVVYDNTIMRCFACYSSVNCKNAKLMLGHSYTDLNDVVLL